MSERQRAATPGNLGRPGRWASVLLLAAAVLLTVAAYPPRGWWLLGLVMLAPLVALLEPARPLRGFALVYAYYVGMGIVIVRWLVHAMAGEYGVPVVAAWSVTLLVVLCYSMPGAIAGGVYCALRTRVGIAAAPVLFGATWGLGEWLRAGPLGLPWLLSGQVVTPAPLALQTADLGGVYAVGFGVVCLNAGVGLAVSARKAAPLALPVIIALLGLGYGAWRLHGLAPRGKPVRVGVVQASVPQSDRFQPGSAERNTLQHMALTRTLASRERVDLVVWSETAVDDDLDALPRLRRSLETLAREIDAPLITGAPRSKNGRRTNSIVVFTPEGGLEESYDKQLLVPFSEYDPPLSDWLRPLLGPVMAGEPYLPGEEATVFRRVPLPVSAPVCFEITYPGLMRRFREAGAQLLVNLSNDAWFGRTGYLELHFRHAIFRAIELRTWVVRGANTGISGVVDPAGRVVASLPPFEHGSLSAEVYAPGEPALYARAGDVPVVVAMLAVLALSLLSGGGPSRFRS